MASSPAAVIGNIPRQAMTNERIPGSGGLVFKCGKWKKRQSKLGKKVVVDGDVFFCSKSLSLGTP